MKKEYTQGVSDANLIQMYCNAVRTKQITRNDVKQHMNISRVGIYIDEIQRRNLDIPDYEEVKKIGVFNGEGSI